MSEKVVKAFKAKTALKDLKKIADNFGIGEALVDQMEEAMDDLAYRGREWALACQEDWSQVKKSVPWMTGNLSEAIQIEDGIEEKGRPYMWVGINLNMLLGPKIRIVANSIDYPDKVGEPINVQSTDYTDKVNKYNKTGPDHFIENVWWVYADKNLKEAMR